MSDPQHQLGEQVGSAAVKIAAGAVPTAYGIVTLNQIALIVGLLSSLAVLLHTLWKWWWDYQDRKARRDV